MRKLTHKCGVFGTYQKWANGGRKKLKLNYNSYGSQLENFEMRLVRLKGNSTFSTGKES